MSWRFRQSFKLIPGVKLNLAKTGLSLSFGGAPLTLNVGRRGVYGTASIPGTGIQFRQRFGGGASAFRGDVTPGQGGPESFPVIDPNSVPPEIPGGMLPPSEPFAPVQEIRSASTELLTSEGLKELKQWLQTAYEEHESISHDLATARSEDARSSARFSSWNNGFLLKKVFKKSFENRKVAAETASAKKQELEEQLRLTTIAAQIDIATEQAELFFRMRDEFAQLSESAAIWDITSQRATDRVRERTSAVRTVDRERVRFDLASCNLIQWEHPVPHLQNINGGDLFLYPGFIIYRAAKTAFSVIDYHDVNLESRSARFVEEQSVPSDASVVGQTWAKVNKDGSRDRRFAGNYQIPIVEYGALVLKSDTGLWEEFQISNVQRVLRFSEAFKAFVRSFSKQSTSRPKSLPSEQRYLPQAETKQSNDISFSCPNCQQHLVVDEAGAGMQISCPTCAATVTIPTKVSSLLQSLKPRAQNLASEKPTAWEHLLFFQVLADEIDRRSKPAETDAVSLMVQNGNHVDREAVLQEMEWLQTMLGDFPGMITELERVLNVSAPESFGPPGQPGDVEKIIAAANEFADIYEKMLNWMHRVHRATFNGPIAKVAVALERSLKPMMQTVQQFPQGSLQKLESALAQHKQSGAPIKLEMCLNLNVGDMSSVSRAMEEVTRSLS
jgi:hypothetical protein